MIWRLRFSASIIMDAEGECVAVCVYNCAPSLSFFIGDTVVVADPHVTEVEVLFLQNSNPFLFMCVVCSRIWTFRRFQTRHSVRWECQTPRRSLAMAICLRRLNLLRHTWRSLLCDYLMLRWDSWIRLVPLLFSRWWPRSLFERKIKKGTGGLSSWFHIRIYNRS